MAEITAQMVKDLREKSGAGMMDCKKALAESEGDMQKAMNLLRERGAAIASKRSSRAAKEGLIASYITPDHKTATLVEFNCESDFVSRGDDFKSLAQTLAAHTAQVDDVSTIMDSKIAGGDTVAETVKNLIGKIGENMVFSRWTKLIAGEQGPKGLIFNYIHPPGKIGVLVEIAIDNDELVSDGDFRSFARDIAMHVAATAPTCVTRDQLPQDVLAQERQIYRNQALNEGKPEKIVDKIVDGRLQKFYAEVCLLEQPFAKNPDQKVEEYVKQNAPKFGNELTVTRFVRYRLGEAADAQA
jgi:elongation factor Ts